VVYGFLFVFCGKIRGVTLHFISYFWGILDFAGKLKKYFFAKNIKKNEKIFLEIGRKKNGSPQIIKGLTKG